ncbi:MAG: GTPase ObgE [Oligoflexia bacterium]|nr:GTPase ObgE [Oligoflexia bacterium]MBF0366081.1 GTPase ObgE [Oligoflexia bacterium]
MKFIDEVTITVLAGNGGNGCIGFRREKYVPYGGPDGGNGGRGGNVYLVANQNLNTLVKFRGRKVYQAEHGEGGQGSQCDGKSGDDLLIPVPVGTIIKYDGEVIADLTLHEQRFKVVSGGMGGLGNMAFKGPTNQAPRYAQDGKPGEAKEITLELKLLADVGLIGLPNAGKSTLISVISNARPKIADYPFTTLVPNLGVVQVGNEEDGGGSFVCADIPGLIEHASEGKGLGIQFLKHIERTKVLVHIIDPAMCVDPYEAYEAYVTVRSELEKYNESLLNKREVVCLTKIDAMSEEEISNYQNYFEEQLGRKVLPISSVSGKNVETLKRLMLKSIRESEG